MWFFEMMDYLREFNYVSVAVRLVLAMVIGGLIGIERGKQGRAAGMRTHILVCLGATLTTMIGFYIMSTPGYSGDPMRIAAQVVSGIGFLGGGTILLTGRFQITGLTTAAGLWTTAAIGLALGAGFYEGALITFLACFITVTLLHKIEYYLGKRQTRFGIYVEIDSDKSVRKMVDHLSSEYHASDIQVTAPRSGTTGNVGIEANISVRRGKLTPTELSEALEKLEYVIFAIESI